MSFAKIQLRLREDLKVAAARQAEVERHFAARGARTTPARARALC